jgi:hypothetical protein
MKSNEILLVTLAISLAALGFVPNIFAHTPEYKQGLSAGKTDALNSGIYDVGSSCGGYTSKECSHYIQGYHDGYDAACASSKFVDACSGDAPGTLKQ